MGNSCCKRQRIHPDLESVKFSSETHLDEIHPSDNNLELYLDDVYKKECELKASQEEVEFIQTGIETLVQDIVDESLEIFSTHEYTDKIFDNEEHKTEIKKYFENDLTDVYFPIKKGSHFQDLTDIKPTRSSIIKVGSFYEDTRNNFPDEFDFIFLLFSGRDILHDFSSFIKTPVSSCIHGVRNRKPFHYASPNGTREIYLDTEIYHAFHGPAEMLEFIYKNGSREERHIAVDFVPAYKINVINQPDLYIKYVNDYVKPKSFRQEIMSAKSCFVVGDSISFTEIEVAFIGNVLSKRHRKVYRILKFLINGHGDDETMKRCLFKEKRRHVQGRHGGYKDNIGYQANYQPYSSYQIKTMMIYHHDECRNSDTTDIGPCVLQVLKKMCKYKNMGTFPTFSDSSHKYRPCLVYYLQSVIGTLNSIQTRTDSYSYEGYKIKSVTMQYMERELMDWLKHENRHTK